MDKTMIMIVGTSAKVCNRRTSSGSSGTRASLPDRMSTKSAIAKEWEIVESWQCDFTAQFRPTAKRRIWTTTGSI